MGQTIELDTSDGARISAYKATPGATPRGALVVVQEAFGVNHHIRSIADRFAAEGYVAIAPALYDRKERHVELGYSKEETKRALAVAGGIPIEQHTLSVEAAVDAVADNGPSAINGPLGIVGFCLGGSLAYILATRSEKLSAAVGFYGGRIAGLAGPALKCPLQLHFGDQDRSISLEDVETIKAAYPDVPVFVYPADHGFNCDERASYDKPSADLAWTRTLAFLAEHMK